MMNANFNAERYWLSRLIKKVPLWVRHLVGLTAAILVLAAVTFLAFRVLYHGLRMFPESSFRLANESRLPKWIAVPPGLTRSDVSLTMDYFTGSSAGFVLKDAKGHTLKEIDGDVKCSMFKLRNPPPGFPPGYPSYAEIVVNGTTEMIEHRGMNDIFYVTDDPPVLKEYRTVGCGS